MVEKRRRRYEFRVQRVAPVVEALLEGLHVSHGGLEGVAHGLGGYQLLGDGGRYLGMLDCCPDKIYVCAGWAAGG